RNKRQRAHRNERAQQQNRPRVDPACGDWYAERVVHEAEEEILSDVAHRGPAETPCANDAPQITLHEGHARALHRDIGTRAHGDAHVRCRERRGVVDAVADMATLRPFARRSRTTSILRSGSTSASPCVMPS